MRIEIAVMGLVAFFVWNTYQDGKYLKMMMAWRKHAKLNMYAASALGLFSLLKNRPEDGRTMLYYANDYVKYLPLDRTSTNMLSPLFDYTDTNEDILSNTMRVTKRSVSETKKKYVASQQGWKCAGCHQQLDHTYEVDHRTRLDQGGTNEVSNLTAYCPHCHRKKTAEELM